MGKKMNPKAIGSSKPSQIEDGLLKTTKENCDDWSQLQSLLPECLLSHSSDMLPAELRILVTACGNSTLSEHLYDAGFQNITNVDSSTAFIADMLERNMIERPEMKWLVMDITDIEIYGDFDAIVDMGGLTTLMRPSNDPKLCHLYIYEVKRLLNIGGKFICVTSAETSVLDLLFLKFRFGWKTSVHNIAQEHKAFVVVVEKDNSITNVSDISLFWDNSNIEPDDDQARNLHEAIERERRARDKHISGTVTAYSLLDLNLGAKGLISVYEPGRIIKLVLGDSASDFCYKAILLDDKQESGFLTNHFVVYIVPKSGSSSLLYASEEGQWNIVKSCNAARVLMVFLDATHSRVSMDDVQADVDRLAKYLAPGFVDKYHTLQIPSFAPGYGINEQEIGQRLPSLNLLD